MPHTPSCSRLPRAGEPIRSSNAALAVISMALHRPLEAETIGFLLDHSNRSSTITVVSGTTEPDAVLSVAECLAAAASELPALCGLVLASVRPAGEPHRPATLPGDIDRWIEANSITDGYAIQLVEWYVVGPFGVTCPRELLGEPERW